MKLNERDQNYRDLQKAARKIRAEGLTDDQLANIAAWVKRDPKEMREECVKAEGWKD